VLELDLLLARAIEQDGLHRRRQLLERRLEAKSVLVRERTEKRLELRQGDLRRPPVEERVPLVTCPFRAYLHLAGDDDRLEALAAARDLLLPGGKLVFDVFTPSAEDIEETDGRWLEREPGIFERADWDGMAQTLTLSVRGVRGESSMTLWWLEPQRWQTLLAEAGFVVESCYGWFDRRPYDGGEDSVWIARK